MENKIRHLEMIQCVINRLSTISFIIKGWSISLITALIVLSTYASDGFYGFIPYLAVALFWGLDGAFLCQGRRYRKLYDGVRLRKEAEIDFQMNADNASNILKSWLGAVFSKTLIPVHGTLFMTILFLRVGDGYFI